MAWFPMYDALQWVDENGDVGSGFVLKAYEPNTTTPISIAIASDGSSPQASITFNAEGKPEVSGNEVVPYIDQNYKYGIFRDSTDAAANSNPFAGFYDNVPVFQGQATTSPFSIPKSSGLSTYPVTSADIGYETKMTAASNVALTLDASTGWNEGDEAIFYFPDATGSGYQMTATAGSGMTLNDYRVCPPGYKIAIKYEGSNIFNWTGP